MSYYPANFDNQGFISYVADFAKWLNREASNPGCTGFSPGSWRVKESPTNNVDFWRKYIKEQCPKYADYYKEHIRERHLEHNPLSKGTCGNLEQKVMDDFFDTYGLNGKEPFCNAASEYFTRQHPGEPSWGYDQCYAQISQTPGGSPGRGGRVSKEVIKKSQNSLLCPYVEGALERAMNFQKKFEAIEGKERAETHPRNEWIKKARKDLKGLKPTETIKEEKNIPVKEEKTSQSGNFPPFYNPKISTFEAPLQIIPLIGEQKITSTVKTEAKSVSLPSDIDSLYDLALTRTGRDRFRVLAKLKEVAGSEYPLLLQEIQSVLLIPS